jgi:ribonucleoside-triphosphate reductase
VLVVPKYPTKISDSVVRQFRDVTPNWGPVGYVTYKRTYARMKDSGLTEEWHETIQRCVNGLLEIGAVYTREQVEQLFYYWFNLKGSLAGRPTWQLGTETVRKIGGDSLQNCFSGNTEILTDLGIKKIDDIIGKTVKVQVLTDRGLIWHETIFHNYGIQQLMEVEFADGTKVKATPNHEWIKYENGKASLDAYTRIFTSDLMQTRKRTVPLAYDLSKEFDQKGYAHGFVFGDGHYYNNDYCAVKIFPSKIDMIEIIQEYGDLTSWSDIPIIINLPKSWKSLPIKPTRGYALGFVLGLGSADGSIRHDFRIHNKNKDTLIEVQKLARFAGLRCHNPYLDREVSPFDGSIKELWCINISTHNLSKDHFIRDDQAAKLTNVRTPKSLQVINVKDLEIKEEVFCCVIPKWHNFTLANGVITGQCWTVAVDQPVEPFIFAFNELMLGGGVGFNICPEYVYALPVVKYNVIIERVETFDCDYIIADNREGWVELLKRVLQAFFITGKNLKYNTHCVRDRGKKIGGFGGVASGAEELVKGIGLITGILQSKLGKKLTPTNCMDIMNIIGSIVVSGNVRRSAEIAVGSYNDTEFMGAKDWSRHPIPPWRQMSNNTIECDDIIYLPEDYWRGYYGQGEAYGLFNSRVSSEYGRLADGQHYRIDTEIVAPNPCGEIILESYEACNLSEIFLPNIDDVHEFAKVAELLFIGSKAISNLKCLSSRTNDVVQRNHRIGTGITGVMQAPHLRDPDILDAVYSHLEDIDVKISREMNISTSVKLTTVKPSGTLSLLAGVSPGGNPEFANFYKRRITFAANDPIIEIARNNGYFMEPKINIDGSRDYNTIIIEFPCKARPDSVIGKNYSAIDQLNNQLFLQTHWADNAVSTTIYLEKDEIPDVQKWLRENYAFSVKTTSFSLHSEHGFPQAPYEEITEGLYNDLISKVKPIVSVEDDELRELLDSVECNTASCPIK